MPSMSTSPCPSVTKETPNRAVQQLISPPPEEELERELNYIRTHSRNNSLQSPAQDRGKRKRTTTLIKNTSSGTGRENTPPPSQPHLVVTPNPKARKQSRKAPPSTTPRGIPESPTKLVSNQSAQRKKSPPISLIVKGKGRGKVKSESPAPQVFATRALAGPPVEDDGGSDDELLLIPRASCTPVPDARSTSLRRTQSLTPTDAGTPPSSPMRLSTPPRRIALMSMDYGEEEDLDFLPPPRFTEFTTDLRASTAVHPVMRPSSPNGGFALKTHSLVDSEEEDEEQQEVAEEEEEDPFAGEDDQEEEEVRQMSVSLSPPCSPGPLSLDDLRPKTPDPFNFRDITSNTSSSLSLHKKETFHTLPSTASIKAAPFGPSPPPSAYSNDHNYSRPSSRASQLYSSVLTDPASGDVSFYPSTELELPKPLLVAAPWDTPRRVVDNRNHCIPDEQIEEEEATLIRKKDKQYAGRAPRKSVGDAWESLKGFTERGSFNMSSPPLPQALKEKIIEKPEDESNEDEDPESDDSSALDLGTVKIMGDKESAERVMAILRLYNYDLKAAKLHPPSAIRKNGKKRRHSYGNIEELKKGNRRSGASSEGVTKGPMNPKNRRVTVGVASASNDDDPQGVFTPVRKLFSSFRFLGKSSSVPPPPVTVRDDLLPEPSFDKPDIQKPQQWTKVHWKILDSCFTDERIHLSSIAEDASVDKVPAKNVVQRFFDLTEGSVWINERDTVIHRVEALRKKQRQGRGAAPTPLRPFRSAPAVETPLSRSVFDQVRREMSLEVPDFTPDVRRVEALASPRFLRHVNPSSPSGYVTPQMANGKGYDALLNEARSVAGNDPQTPTPLQSYLRHEDQDNSQDSPENKSLSSYLFSYLPTVSMKPSIPKRVDGRPGLPAPPSYKVRDVNTPPPPTRVRSIPHKELVELSHVEIEERKRQERKKEEAKRLVALKRVVPPSIVKDREAEEAAKRKSGEAMRMRTVSGTSVKDLVGTYERNGGERNSRPVSRLGGSGSQLGYSSGRGGNDSQPWR